MTGYNEGHDTGNQSVCRNALEVKATDYRSLSCRGLGMYMPKSRDMQGKMMN